MVWCIGIDVSSTPKDYMKRKAHSGAAISLGKGGDVTEDENLKDLLNKKHQRGEEDSSGIVDDGASPRSPSAPKKHPAPKYGSKEYWDARYKSHMSGADDCMQLAKDRAADVNGDGCVVDGVLLSKEALKPGHEWYFSYDELRPLIMPLILGSIDNEVVESDYDEDEDAESWVEEGDEGDEGEEGDEGDEGDKGDEGDEGDEGEWVKKEDCDDDSIIFENVSGGIAKCEENSGNSNIVIEKNENSEHAEESPKPKRVLEVGCGDKPLGLSLASDLISMQAEMGIDAKLLLEEVTCIDYSDIVIQRLNGQSLNGKESHLSNDSSTLKKPEIIKPTYQAMDARSLPFSSNMYDLILEKGTLDAMLSDEEEGLSNCVKIVKEMARVTSEGGAILIVSHLNANEPKGMAWLEDVVFCGLKIDFLERRKSRRDRAKASRCESSGEKKNTETSETVNDDDDKEYVWSVEVHGGDGQYLDENGDEIEDADENAVLVYGPAVYIIKKKSVPAAIANELFGGKKVRQTKEDFSQEVELVEMPPVKLTFITY